MLTTILADTHFCNPRPFATITNGYNSRFLNQLNTLELIPKDTDILIHVGDLFDNKFRVETQVYDRVYSKFVDLNLPTVLVCGNHDKYTINKEPVLVPFNEVSQVVSYGYYNFDVDGVRFHCIPYTKTHITKYIEQAINSKCHNVDILLTHIGVIEGLVGASNTHLKHEIPLDYLQPEKFNYIILGHYHKHQKIRDNVYYVGSPLQQNFGEAGEKKGIMTFNTETLKLEFIENTNAPKFIVYEVSNEKQLAKLPLNTNDFYKITLNRSFDSDFINQFSNDYNILYEGGASVKRETRLSNTKSNVEIMNEYIGIVGDSGLDRKKLINTGVQYL